MSKIDKQKIPYNICACFLLIGVLLFVFNANNLKHNSFFNEDSVRDNVSHMRKNYAILGYSFDSEMYESIYEDDAKSGNTAIVGIAISIISLIVMLAFYLKQLKSGTTKQTELLGKLTETSEQSIDSRLSELLNLKEKGLITEEEYNLLREQTLKRISG